VAVYLLACAAPAATRETSPVAGKEAATESARVVARRVGDLPRTFELEVENRGSSPIVLFVLGSGERPEMQAIAENIPLEISGPEGWRGTKVFEEESIFMHLLWEAVERDRAVAPGKKLAGFRVRMPQLPRREQQLYHSDGTPMQELDLPSAPFTVCFAGGACVHGKVEPAN